MCLGLWLLLLIVGVASGGATDRLLLMGLCLAAALLALTVGPAMIWREWKNGGFMLLVPVVIGLIQLIPLPRVLLSSLAPLHATLLAPGRQWAPLSLYPFATLDTACLWTVYALSFAFGAVAARTPRTAAMVGGVGLTAVALFQAVYGIISQGLIRAPSAAVGEEAPFGIASGTYPNRDHYACLLAIVAPLVLAGLLFRERGLPGERRWNQPNHASRLVVQSLLLAVLVLGAIYSFSRGGLGALSFGLGVVLLIAAFRARGSGQRSATALAFIVLAIAIAGAGQLFGQWLSRLHPEVVQADPRWLVWRDSLSLVADHPLLGVGLGGFPNAFLAYARARYGTGIWMDAHSELVQLAVEIGLPGAIAVYAALLAWAGRAIRAASNTKRNLTSAAALAGTAGGLAAFIMVSLADFPIHVPGNTMVALTLAGYAQTAARNAFGHE